MLGNALGCDQVGAQHVGEDAHRRLHLLGNDDVGAQPLQRVDLAQEARSHDDLKRRIQVPRELDDAAGAGRIVDHDHHHLGGLDPRQLEDVPPAGVAVDRRGAGTEQLVDRGGVEVDDGVRNARLLEDAGHALTTRSVADQHDVVGEPLRRRPGGVGRSFPVALARQQPIEPRRELDRERSQQHQQHGGGEEGLLAGLTERGR